MFVELRIFIWKVSASNFQLYTSYSDEREENVVEQHN